MSEGHEVCQLYLITPNDLGNVHDFAVQLESALKAGYVAVVQLRMKLASDNDIIEACHILQPVCHKYEVAFLLNDRADLAADVDADGVHLGQGDRDIASARSLLGAGKDIGVTCHDSMHLAFEAGEAGANYVAFGAFYETATKNTSFRSDPEILTNWDAVTDLPCVAIGGITPENCKILADAGAHFVAVCSAVWGHIEGPEVAVQAFHEALNA